MALRTAVANGAWNVAGTWNTGVPVLGDTVNWATFDVTVPAGYTTAKVAQGDGGGGGGIILADGGVLDNSGLFTFDSGETFEPQPGSELLWNTAENGNAYARFYIGSTLKLGGDPSNLVYMHGVDGTKRPVRGLQILGPITADSFLNGLHSKWIRTHIDWRGPSLSLMQNVHMEQGLYGILALQGVFYLAHACIHGMAITGLSMTTGALHGSNLSLGEDLAQGADANAIDVKPFKAAAWLANARLESATQVSLTRMGDMVGAANGGYISTEGILTTAGALGTDKLWQYIGTAEDSGGAKVLTPNTNCGDNWPLVVGAHQHSPIFAPIPATGGQTITVTVVVEPNASQPANSVELALDPYNLYGCQDVSTAAVPAGSATTLTVAGTVSGSAQVAVPWEVRVTDYGAGGTVTISRATVTVGGQRAQLFMPSWKWPLAPLYSTIGQTHSISGYEISHSITPPTSISHEITP